MWRAPFDARRPPTASMSKSVGSTMRIGRTGTPRTWWRSRPAKSCRNERLAAIVSLLEERARTTGFQPRLLKEVLMKRIIFVLVTVAAVAGVVAYIAPAYGQA